MSGVGVWEFSPDEVLSGHINESPTTPIGNNALSIDGRVVGKIIRLPLCDFPDTRDGRRYLVELSIDYFMDDGSFQDLIPSHTLDGLIFGIEANQGESIWMHHFLGDTVGAEYVPASLFHEFALSSGGAHMHRLNLIGSNGDFGMRFRFEIGEDFTEIRTSDAGGSEFGFDTPLPWGFSSSDGVNVVIGLTPTAGERLEFGDLRIEVIPIPEPSTALLAGLSFLSLLGRRGR